MFNDVVEHPADYGLTNVTGTCSNYIADEASKKSVLRMVARVTPKARYDACEGYLFFDLVHPTAIAHQTIAEKIREMLDANNVKFAE
jgi:phospholipase/lecithinase/hemolysin